MPPNRPSKSDHAFESCFYKKGLRDSPRSPECGQSEIRTRGRLPFNGFQDRLFRPLRHLSNVHNARNVNIAQHSEIIGIARHKSPSLAVKCHLTIPKTTQHRPNADAREHSTNPTIPKTTQTNPKADAREHSTNPTIPKTTQTTKPKTQKAAPTSRRRRFHSIITSRTDHYKPNSASQRIRPPTWSAR